LADETGTAGGVDTEATEELTESTLEEIAGEVQGLFQEVINGLDIDAAAGVRAIEGTDIHVDADGDEEGGGILIGRRGQTLEAIQLILSSIISRQHTRKVRVFLDAFGYRERRAESLRQMAMEVAEQVRSAGQEALTEPLNAAERRIVHTALQDVEGVSTYSEGEDPNRYVVITPAEGQE
jgi:spoIIIJ-associated protein